MLDKIQAREAAEAEKCCAHALAVGGTRAGGSVLAAARRLAGCPDPERGRCPETIQARGELRAAIAEAAAGYGPSTVAAAAKLILAGVIG